MAFYEMTDEAGRTVVGETSGRLPVGAVALSVEEWNDRQRAASELSGKNALAAQEFAASGKPWPFDPPTKA